MAAALCASYIGGSINFAATAQALGLVQRGLLAACMTADNLAMGLYLSAVMVVPVDNDESKNKSKDKEMQGDKNKEVQGGKDTRKEKHCNSIHEAAGVDSTRQTASVETHTSHHASSGHPNPVPTTSTSLTTALAAAAVSCSVGWWGAHALQSPHLALTLTALACAGVAAVTPEHVFAGEGVCAVCWHACVVCWHVCAVCWYATHCCCCMVVVPLLPTCCCHPSPSYTHAPQNTSPFLQVHKCLVGV